MKLKLGVRINIHNRHFLYEYLPSGRIEQETGDELLMEDGDFLLWEGYSLGENPSLLTESDVQLLQENGSLIIVEGGGYALQNRLAQEDGFNILQETGDYLNYDGEVPVRIALYQETGFNLLQEDGYQLLVDRY